MPIWLREKLFQKKMIMDYLKEQDKNFKDENKILFSEHHLRLQGYFIQQKEWVLKFLTVKMKLI